MNALTRFESTTPVRYDVMNDICTEVEARDKILDDKINVLKGVEYTLTLQSGWTAISGYSVFALKIGKSISVSGFIGGGSDVGGSIICDLPFTAKHLKKVELCNATSIVGSATVSGDKLWMDACTNTQYVFFNFDYIVSEV